MGDRFKDTDILCSDGSSYIEVQAITAGYTEAGCHLQTDLKNDECRLELRNDSIQYYMYYEYYEDRCNGRMSCYHADVVSFDLQCGGQRHISNYVAIHYSCLQGKEFRNLPHFSLFPLV